MPKVQRDSVGLWVNAGNYICRPVIETSFKEGDSVKTYHFGGSCKAGVGKGPLMGRGKYREYWTTTGGMADYHDSYSDEELQAAYLWYRSQFALLGHLSPQHPKWSKVQLLTEEGGRLNRILATYSDARRERGEWW